MAKYSPSQSTVDRLLDVKSVKKISMRQVRTGDILLFKNNGSWRVFLVTSRYIDGRVLGQYLDSGLNESVSPCIETKNNRLYWLGSVSRSAPKIIDSILEKPPKG